MSRRSGRYGGLHARARGAGARGRAAGALVLEPCQITVAAARLVARTALSRLHVAPSSGALIGDNHGASNIQGDSSRTPSSRSLIDLDHRWNKVGEHSGLDAAQARQQPPTGTTAGV